MNRAALHCTVFLFQTHLTETVLPIALTIHNHVLRGVIEFAFIGHKYHLILHQSRKYCSCKIARLQIDLYVCYDIIARYKLHGKGKLTFSKTTVTVVISADIIKHKMHRLVGYTVRNGKEFAPIIGGLLIFW